VDWTNVKLGASAPEHLDDRARTLNRADMTDTPHSFAFALGPDDQLLEIVACDPVGLSGHWRVVNTGREATQEGCLRGGFYRSNTGSGKRFENTLYRGMHWVECFIVKEGVCVAKSEEFVVNIE